MRALVKKRMKEMGLPGILTQDFRPPPVRRLLGVYLDALGILDGLYAYKGPECAQIDLTNNCNNDCIGCWCNSPLLEEKKISPETKKQTIPLARVVRLIDELHKMGSRHIYYAGGGEPFMHPSIMEILAYTKKKGLECYVNTNFTLLDEKMVRELAAIGVDALTVSVWAGTAGVYAACHPNKNEATFYKIKETLQLLNRLKHKRPVTKVYNVVFNRNYQDMEAMFDFAIETASDAVEFTVIDTIPGKTDKLLLNEAERRLLLESCRRVSEKHADGPSSRIMLLGMEQFMRRLSNADALAAEYDSNIINKIPCYAGWAFVRILADGNVNSCLKSHRFPVGNILTQGFKEAWNSSRQRYFRKKTFAMKKDDPFFSLIGNDHDSGMGCYKSCDNLGHSMYMHGRFSGLSGIEKRILHCVAKTIKLIRMD